MPKVSAIIPAFNAGELLGPTLEAALNSSCKDLQLVVVDDGSTDNTAEVASRYGSRVALISQPNAGMSASRNRAAEASDSEYIALLDADDIWHPEKIARQLETLTNQPSFDFAFTEFTEWDGSAAPIFKQLPQNIEINEQLSGWIYHKMILTNWTLPSSVMLRRSAWDSLGPFLCEDHQTDDWEYLTRASWHHKFIKLQEPLVFYRQHPSSLSRRVSPINNTELMREHLIQKFGTCSPDGTPVDAADLARRRHKSWADFASRHCTRGSLPLGAKTFANLAVSGPKRNETAMRFAKSLVRRAQYQLTNR